MGKETYDLAIDLEASKKFLKSLGLLIAASEAVNEAIG